MANRLRIAISARGLNAPFSGPRAYIDGFTRAFSEIDSNYEVYVYYNTSRFVGRYPKAKEKVLPKTYSLIWDHFTLPLALLRDKINIAIFPKGTIPLIRSYKSIPIMLDLGYFFPEINAYKKEDTLYMKAGLNFAARKAWGIFSISQNTANDVVDLFQVSKSQVKNIYGGVDRKQYAPVTNPDILEKIKSKYALQMPFMFYPTSISPRKNIDRVLDSFEKIQGDIPHHLYFTGSLSWNSPHTEERLKGTIGKRVHRLGSVPQEDMASLYSLSAFTIYPSLFEGFGLPVIEAFLCESAVLTSDQTSLPEVAGDAALIVPAYNTQAIAAGMLRLAKDQTLRQSLIEKGKQQASIFTWETTAQAAITWIDKNVQSDF